MKHLLLFAIIVILCSACTGDLKNDRGIVIGDTIKTTSGLQYIFTKIGEGRPVETGSRVWTYLALSVNGKEVWNTNEEKDSSFVFVANKDRMIAGFTEVTMKLREGDEIIAVLPPQLAYGERGSGNVIPPNATLVYTKYKMKKVGEPKASLSDTLFTAYKSGGHAAMVAAREQILNSADTAKYYYDKGQWRLLWSLLTEVGMHKEALQMIAFANTGNESTFRWLRVRSYDRMTQYQRALDSLNVLIASDTTYVSNVRALELKAELIEKVKKK